MDGKKLLMVALLVVAALAGRDHFGAAGAKDGTDRPDGTGETNVSRFTKLSSETTRPPPAEATPAFPPEYDVLAQTAADFAAVASPSGSASTTAPFDATTVVLATLPSPLSNSFAADFDRAVESIGRAAQSEGYILQRHWFPWQDAHRGAGHGKPGWLVFRRSVGKTWRLLIVLIVSERPSSGVDREEIVGALEVASSLLTQQPVATQPLLLLGPSFSGSATSLEQQLRHWCGGRDRSVCGARPLVALSGSATVRHTQDILQRLADVFAGSAFHATVLPDDLLQAGMRQFLRDRLGVADGKVADLIETSTAYGLDASERDDKTAPAGGPAASGDCQSHRNARVEMPFPMHVSVLAEGGGKSSDEELPFLFSKEADARRQIGLQLDDTFASLSRRRTEHVGIVASSTPDKIFLAGQFRQFAPNLRVHMYESSVDLADRSKRDALEGIMVASSYPLFPMAQVWASEAGLQQFPSMAAEGTYNALVGLLAIADGTEGIVSKKLLDYHPLFGGDGGPGPSAWISVSMGGRLWPLVAYAGADLERRRAGADGYIYAPQSGRACRLAPERASLSTLAYLGALSILMLLAGNLIGLCRGQNTFTWWRWPLLSYGAQDQDASTTDHKRVEIAGLWSLTLTAVVMGRIIEFPDAFGWTLAWWDRGLGYALTSGAFLLLVAHLLLAAPICSTKRRLAPLLAQLAFLVALGLALGATFGPKAVPRGDGHEFFFFLRAMDSSIGLTPTIPLFIAGMTIYVASLLQLSVLRRATALARRAEDWAPIRMQSFSKCATAMRDFAQTSGRSVLMACLVGGAVGFAVLFRSPLQLGSFEGRWFDGGCSACFGLIFTLSLAAAWRSYELWVRLQMFTRALAIHPAVAALDRLPESVAQRFRTPVPGSVGDRHIEIALEMNQHARGQRAPLQIATVRDGLDARWFPAAYPTAAASRTALQDTMEALEEDFLALKMAEVLGLMCDATRRMLFIATASGMAALFGYAIYPFQPGAALTLAGVISVGVAALVALRVLLGIERDHVLSHAAKTTAGTITPSLSLAGQLLGYVVVPLGGLIGARLQNPAKVVSLLQDLATMLSR